MQSTSICFWITQLRVHKQEALLVIQMVWVMGKLEGNSFGESVGELLDYTIFHVMCFGEVICRDEFAEENI